MIRTSDVWKIGVGPNDFFEYQIGPIKTNSPWLSPSYPRSKRLINDILALPNANKYRFEILGGCLFGWKSTWDLDVFMFDGPDDWTILEDLYFKAIDLALNTYRIKLDITYNSADMLPGLNYFGEEVSHIKVRKVRKQINSSYDEVDLLEKPGSIALGDHLVKANWPSPNPKLLTKLNKFPDLITTFNAELFLSTDEAYFIENSNHKLLI